jgi:hypothetical protein
MLKALCLVGRLLRARRYEPDKLGLHFEHHGGALLARAHGSRHLNSNIDDASSGCVLDVREPCFASILTYTLF